MSERSEPLELPFTHKPGRRERHLKRRHANPLFGWPLEFVEPLELLAAQKADHEEMEAFQQGFRASVQQAVELPPDAGSEVVLALKGELERLYETSFGLPEDHTSERAALQKLIDLIMRAVRRAAGYDPLAQQELAEEETARAIHFRLLEQPLVADLLHPESPITPAELTPTILAASHAEIEAVLELFDPDQAARIAGEGARLIETLAAHGLDVDLPRRRIALILARLEPHSQASRH